MSKIKYLLKIIKSKGILGVIQLVQKKFFSKKITTIQNLGMYLNYFDKKNGIEIGGPSDVFSTVIPIYQVVAGLDGCNFSTKTIWEGTIIEGENFNYFESKKGFQYICEASNLIGIPDAKYDFLIASHCLEHCANTLKTVNEWLRVVKKGGAILLILPDRRYTFDHNRPITDFKHFLQDVETNVDESDLTHLNEILELHDLSRDVLAGSKEQFKRRSKANHENRCLHHHVFDFDLLRKIYKHNNVKVIDMSFEKPNHQIILGIKK